MNNDKLYKQMLARRSKAELAISAAEAKTEEKIVKYRSEVEFCNSVIKTIEVSMMPGVAVQNQVAAESSMRADDEPPAFLKKGAK